MSVSQMSTPVFEQPPASSKIPDEWSQLAQGAADAQASNNGSNDQLAKLRERFTPIFAATEMVSAWARGLRLPEDLRVQLVNSNGSHLDFALVFYTNGVWVLHQGDRRWGPLRADRALDALNWYSIDVNKSLHEIGRATTYYALIHDLPLPDFAPR